MLSSGWTIQQMFQENLNSFIHWMHIWVWETEIPRDAASLSLNTLALVLGKPAHPWERSLDKAAEGINLQCHAQLTLVHFCLSSFSSCPAGAPARKSCGKYRGSPGLGIASTVNHKNLRCLYLIFCGLIPISPCSLSDILDHPWI